MRRSIRLSVFPVTAICCGLLLADGLARAQAPSVPPAASDAFDRAAALFRAQKWSEAASSFEDIVKRDPSDGRAWFQLGLARHAMGEYRGAITALEAAAKLPLGGLLPAGVRFRMARAYARLDDKDQAFAWLNKAIDAGFLNKQLLDTDPDIVNLRADPRFAEINRRMIAQTRPCTVDAEYRRLDFFIGEWDLQNKQGQSVQGTSVRLILGDCVLEQVDTVPNGYGAKGLHFYNSTLGKWQATYMDTLGAFAIFSVEFKDGNVAYVGELRQPDRSMQLARNTFIKDSPDRIGQLYETSADGGKTWRTAFEGAYVRKK